VEVTPKPATHVVTVAPTSVGGTATATDAIVCSGTGTTITLTGYTGTIQWQSKTTGEYADISGQTGTTLSTGSLVIQYILPCCCH